MAAYPATSVRPAGRRKRGRTTDMFKVPLPSHENDRLAQLIWFQILDTPPEEGFDRITRTAARVMETPIALVSLVDRDRQWFKSTCGLSVNETSRDVAFCSYTVMQRSPLVVENALADPRFRDNALVTGEPHIRAYAGIPLLTDDGFALGSLCVIDTKPRSFTSDQMACLDDLAETIMDLMRYRLMRSDIRQSTDMFSAQVSHEIRTPLNAIIGFSEALRSGVHANAPERAGAYLDMIASSGRDLDQTLGRLLDEARSGSGFSNQLEPMVPFHTVQDILPALQAAGIDHGIDVTNELSDKETVIADDQIVRRILLKLTINAINYNVDGGHVRISGQEMPNDWFRIKVEDTGIGIARSAHATLFETPASAKRPTGLASVKALAEKLGGHVGFCSRPGVGSEFWIDLPRMTQRRPLDASAGLSDDAFSAG